MKTIRKADERGATKIDWLDSKHTFSFGRYIDHDWVNFGPLRVINDDVVAPGAGFSPHSHANMEIITYVLKGELSHKDSLGNGSTIRPFEVQMMSAGSGIEHSEFNGRDDRPVHLYQMWVIPSERDTQPTYQQQRFVDIANASDFRVVVSPDGQDGSLKILQDASLSIGQFDEGVKIDKPLSPDRSYWLQIAEGNVTVNGVALSTGDAIGLKGEDSLAFTSDSIAHVLMFDMAA